MKLILAVLATLASTPVLAQGAPAAAQKPECYKREEVTKSLMRQGASPVVAGKTTNPNNLLEIWEDKDGDWTLFTTIKRADEVVMCPMMTGRGKVRTAPQRCIDPIVCPRV